MANPVLTDISPDGSIVMFTYTLTTADHTGAAIAKRWAQWADRSVLFQSVAWGGATAAFEGSNDESVFVPIADGLGNPVASAANAIFSPLDITAVTRARLSTVGVGATVVVSIVCRRPQNYRS